MTRRQKNRSRIAEEWLKRRNSLSVGELLNSLTRSPNEEKWFNRQLHPAQIIPNEEIRIIGKPLKRQLLQLLQRQLEGEPISQEEEREISEIELLLALSASADAEKIADAESEILQIYQDTPEQASHPLGIYCPDIEDEMIQYFRKHPEEMYSMAPRKFEELVASIFKNYGFKVELTPATRDGGVDIIAVENSKLTGENIHFIECKRYGPDKYVGIGIVQRLLGVVTQRQATKGVIVTTSFFTSESKKVAANTKHILTLRDYDLLIEWLKDICP